MLHNYTCQIEHIYKKFSKYKVAKLNIVELIEVPTIELNYYNRPML